jgi:tetratricopeptide (TPR) repeat protein
MALSVDQDPHNRLSFVMALARLKAAAALPLITATPMAGYEYGARQLAQAVIHFDPASVLPLLDRWAGPFRRASWPARLRGQALWQLGDLAGALASFRQAVEKEDDSDNWLALAHFHLEQGELQTAGDHINKALAKNPKWFLPLLSQAVVLWLMGRQAEALEKLGQARRKYRGVIPAKDLADEHFWRSKALAALAEMLAQTPGG